MQSSLTNKSQSRTNAQTYHPQLILESEFPEFKQKNQITEISKIHNNKNIPRSIHIN